MDLIWGHISTEPMRCPQLKNIGLTLWAIRKTSFLFSGHVLRLLQFLSFPIAILISPLLIPLAMFLNILMPKNKFIENQMKCAGIR